MSREEPPRADLVLWRGDDDPSLVWEFGDASTPNILQGSTFTLIVQWGESGELTRRSDEADSGLVVDVVARTVTWAYAIADVAGLPRGPVAGYELKRHASDRTRTWAWGTLIVKSGLPRG